MFSLRNKENYQRIIPITPIYLKSCSRLAKRREILIFPRTAGNTGNSREILVIPGKYW